MERIEALRAEIDEVDDRLLELLARRARLAHAIGEVKRDAGLALVDPRREDVIKDRLAARAGPATAPLDASAVRRLWTAVLHECRRVVQRVAHDPEDGGSA